MIVHLSCLMISISTGKAALDAINIFHPGCYYGFAIENIKDQVLQDAYYGIIRTCGQVPKVISSIGIFHSISWNLLSNYFLNRIHRRLQPVPLHLRS